MLAQLHPLIKRPRVSQSVWLHIEDVCVLLPLQAKLAELKEKEKEVKDLQEMAEDDVAQVNDLLVMLQDSKEVGPPHCPQHTVLCSKD